jgi:preprotein translocase subunit SecY
VGQGLRLLPDISPGDPYYELIFLSLIVFFTFFYVSIVFNVEEVADNLRKHGGFMPGIRPGKATAEYLNTILTRLTTVGAIYLALVAFVPQFMLSGFKVGRLPLIGTWFESFVSTTPGLSWIPTGMGYQFLFRRYVAADSGRCRHGHGGADRSPARDAQLRRLPRDWRPFAGT